MSHVILNRVGSIQFSRGAYHEHAVTTFRARVAKGRSNVIHYQNDWIIIIARAQKVSYYAPLLARRHEALDSFDPDEFFTFAVCAFMSVFGAYRWFRALIKVRPRPGSAPIRLMLWLLPISLLLLLQVVLSRWADPVVRVTQSYDLLFLFGGGAWLSGTVFLMPWFGVDVRIDALEQGNAASAIAACGALTGTMMCYIGSNIGQGDSIATTFIPAIGATGLFALLWMLVTATTPVAVRIAIERQTGAGVRLAIYLTIIGLVFGRACAGNWISLDDTIHDLFVMSWSAGLATIAFIVLERMVK